MRIALLQYPIAWADKETNLRLAEQRIAALAGQADVAVLPEMFATGFCTDHPELAETMDGKIMTTLQRIANQYEIAIVGSFICLPTPPAAGVCCSPAEVLLKQVVDVVVKSAPFKLVNRGFMVVPHGDVQIQDKRHLYAHGGEDLFFRPAEERCIFEYQGVKILLLVCYDLRFPVWARNQSGSDYDIILVVANWPDIRIQYWDALIAARATENQCYIAAVNCVGDDGMGLHYNGHSVAYDTRLQPIVSFADDEEGTKIADFDIAKLHHFREVLPLWKDVDHFEIKKI
ncbi:MAG: nitrilase family protein [Paludibacteraceae bacterium]|nr:nitrilase family protein [Paludibacteraceae bacterium]